MNLDFVLIRHTKHFSVLFDSVHPDDGHRARSKHVGVFNKQS
jgi:hypothetical protein